MKIRQIQTSASATNDETDLQTELSVGALQFTDVISRLSRGVHRCVLSADTHPGHGQDSLVDEIALVYQLDVRASVAMTRQ